jgi:hypothetical protein
MVTTQLRRSVLYMYINIQFDIELGLRFPSPIKMAAMIDLNNPFLGDDSKPINNCKQN